MRSNEDRTRVDFIVHDGILGMRWGRRRFQNEDGSLTPAGRERYREGKTKIRAPKSGGSSPRLVGRKAKQEAQLKQMSNAELKTNLDRMEMERRYRQMAKEERERTMSSGQKAVRDLVKRVGDRAVDRITDKTIDKAFDAGFNMATNVASKAINKISTMRSKD